MKKTKTQHDIRIDRVREKLDDLMMDKSVTIEELIATFGMLIGEIEIKMDALRSDLE